MIPISHNLFPCSILTLNPRQCVYVYKYMYMKFHMAFPVFLLRASKFCMWFRQRLAPKSGAFLGGHKDSAPVGG